MDGIKLSTPTISVSVQLQVFSFWFVELVIGNPLPSDTPPLECPHIFGWIANYASTLTILE
jgi:hypothetical protein